MPRKKIVSTDLPNPAGIAADESAVETKPRKTGAKTLSASNRVKGKKTIGAKGKVTAEAIANQENAAILGSSVSEEEQIALLAYSYWEARGRQGGSAEEDWHRAVREFRSRGDSY